MSSRKTKTFITPKSNVKSNTPSFGKLKTSTPKTEPKQPSSKIVKNLNSRGNTPCANSTINTTIVDPTHSQKYMQHKVDMAYNKYLQTLALNSWLAKMHKEADISIDEQLVHYEEMYESASKEEQTNKNILNELSFMIATENKLKCLESSLQTITQFIEEKKQIDKIKKLNSNLHHFCDKLMFENMKFINTEENYNMLKNTLDEISTTLNELKVGNNEDFLTLTDYIFNIIELLKSLRKNQKVVKSYQNDINNLTLRAASIGLSEKYGGNTLKN